MRVEEKFRYKKRALHRVPIFVAPPAGLPEKYRDKLPSDTLINPDLSAIFQGSFILVKNLFEPEVQFKIKKPRHFRIDAFGD